MHQLYVCVVEIWAMGKSYSSALLTESRCHVVIHTLRYQTIFYSSFQLLKLPWTTLWLSSDRAAPPAWQKIGQKIGSITWGFQASAEWIPECTCRWNHYHKGRLTNIDCKLSVGLWFDMYLVTMHLVGESAWNNLQEEHCHCYTLLCQPSSHCTLLEFQAPYHNFSSTMCDPVHVYWLEKAKHTKNWCLQFYNIRFPMHCFYITMHWVVIELASLHAQEHKRGLVLRQLLVW